MLKRAQILMSKKRTSCIGFRFTELPSPKRPLRGRSFELLQLRGRMLYRMSKEMKCDRFGSYINFSRLVFNRCTGNVCTPVNILQINGCTGTGENDLSVECYFKNVPSTKRGRYSRPDGYIPRILPDGFIILRTDNGNFPIERVLFLRLFIIEFRCLG